jgi:hypothetical protein
VARLSCVEPTCTAMGRFGSVLLVILAPSRTEVVMSIFAATAIDIRPFQVDGRSRKSSRQSSEPRSGHSADFACRSGAHSSAAPLDANCSWGALRWNRSPGQAFCRSRDVGGNDNPAVADSIRGMKRRSATPVRRAPLRTRPWNARPLTRGQRGGAPHDEKPAEHRDPSEQDDLRDERVGTTGRP